MRRVALSLLLIFFLLSSGSGQAASQLEKYSSAAEAANPGQIIWKLSGLGKITEDMVMAPNGNLLIPTGSKMSCVDPEGKLLWEVKAKGGNMGRPVALANGSIFTSSGGTIQETKLNGAAGWSCFIYSAAKASKSTLLAGGSDNILYLPLPDALYGIDTSGCYAWMLSPWDSGESLGTRVTNPRTILASAADQHAFYVVYGEKSGSYKLAAIDQQGRRLWTYWLGDVISAHLQTSGGGKLYASVTFNKSSSGNDKSKLNTGRVYCFSYETGSTVVWNESFKISDEMTAPCISGDNVLYVTGASKIYALDADNGKELWVEPLLELVSPPAAVVNGGRIYAGSSEDDLYAVSQSGRLVWDRELDGAVEYAPLTTKGNFIYVMTKKGSLYKIQDNYQES